MSAASKTLWEKYVGAYHGFWDYLEEHEEILQERSNVTLVCGIMEECPVVNFSCVRDLIYTMRQFLGEKHFKEKESQWRANLNLMVDRCINNDICNLTVEVRHPYSFHQEACDYRMSYKDFYDTYTKLHEQQEHLRKLPVTEYHSLVYGQSIYRQQALVLNFKILRTFCDNLAKYFKVEPSDCRKVLQRLTREALNPEALCIQAVDGYMDELKSTSRTLTRISVWPMYEPVVGSYDERKEFLIKCWEAQSKPKSTMPPIYTPQLASEGGVCFWWKTLEGSEPTEVSLQSIPHKISASKHFQRVMTIVQSKSGDYGLYHDQTDPNKESNWVYYIVMFDAIVSPETAEQGYIGETTNTLLARIKQHTRQEDMIIRYNLALLSRFLQQRGEELSDYVAVFALGTTKEKTSCKKIEGKLIRESLDGFSVADMKYGMNCKQGSTANNEQNEQDIQNEHPACFKLTGELKEETPEASHGEFSEASHGEFSEASHGEFSEASHGETSEASHGETSEERHTETMLRECSNIRLGEDTEMRNGGYLEVRQVLEIRQISEIQYEDSETMTESETRRGEDTETRRGEDTEMRQRRDTETRQGGEYGVESGMRCGDSATRYGQESDKRYREDLEMGNGEDSVIKDAEINHISSTRKIQYGNSETRYGEDTEMMQNSEMKDGEDAVLRNGEDSEMENPGSENGEDLEMDNPEDSGSENGEDLEMENPEDSGSENGEDPEMENPEDSGSDNGEDPEMENSEDSGSENGEDPEMENPEDSGSENGEDSGMENPEDSESENGEDSEMENPEDSGSENGEDSEMENPEDSGSENGEDSEMENPEDSGSENGEDLEMENGKDSQIENREDSVLENSRVTKGEYSKRDSEMVKASKMGEDSQRKHSTKDFNIQHNVELNQECSEKLKYTPKSLMKSDAEEHKMKELLMEELERQKHMIQKRNEHKRSM